MGEGSREGVGGPRGWVEDPGGGVRVGEVSRGGGGVVPGCVGVPFTLPTGNLRRNSGLLLVTPNWKCGGVESTRRHAPLYCAAISTLKARQFSG